MNQNRALFLELLKSGLWDIPFERILSKEEFSSVWTDATRQSTRGFIGHAIMSHAGQSYPLAVTEMVQRKLLSIARQDMKVEHILALSVKALASKGIRPVLLKGPGVASFCHEPYLRESGDIDLYVGEALYRQSFDTLDIISDYHPDNVFEKDGKHSHVDIDGITIEVHRLCEELPSPRKDRAFQRITAESLSGDAIVTLPTLGFEGVTVGIPEATFNAFFVFNHIWRHFAPIGVGFRQVCDWAVLLKANYDRIDIGRLESYLHSVGIMRPWQVFGSIAVDFLGLPSSKMPFYNPSMRPRALKVMDMMFAEGNFGHERLPFWAMSRESFLGRLKVFMVNSKRHVSLFPLFGKAAADEFISRIGWRLRAD